MALPTLVERHEVLLLLGAPAKHSVVGKGTALRTIDDWADGCWLNQPSTVHFDAAELAIGKQATCICGFCVDATVDLGSARGEAWARDEHWTRGPWVRLDGRLDVTADHRILTPSGPRAVSALSPGDLVLDDEGAPRPLLAIEHLPPGPPRLGANLRTTTGTFVAGGLTFESEAPRACP